MQRATVTALEHNDLPQSCLHPHRKLLRDTVNFTAPESSTVHHQHLIAAGPLEMAKNRVQAGLVAEPLLQYTVSGRGFRDTLPFMGPFMLASVPQDFAELTLYYQGHKILEKLPEDSWPRCLIREHVFVVDAALGACAGICAVMLSMPADCIKTKLLTNYGAGGACGPCSSVSFSRALPGARTAWMGAARRTAAEQGPRGFFVGMVPRAVDEVPGSILHWTFAEGCTRWLEKF